MLAGGSSESRRAPPRPGSAGGSRQGLGVRHRRGLPPRRAPEARCRGPLERRHRRRRGLYGRARGCRPAGAAYHRRGDWGRLSHLPASPGRDQPQQLPPAPPEVPTWQCRSPSLKLCSRQISMERKQTPARGSSLPAAGRQSWHSQDPVPGTATRQRPARP